MTEVQSDHASSIRHGARAAKRTAATRVTVRVGRSSAHASAGEQRQDLLVQDVTRIVGAYHAEVDVDNIKDLYERVRESYAGAKLRGAGMEYYEQIDPETGKVIVICVESPKIVVPDEKKPKNPVVVERIVTSGGPFKSAPPEA